MVQRNAMRAWEERRAFLECLEADPEVTERLGPEALKACFDPAGTCATSTLSSGASGLAEEGRTT